LLLAERQRHQPGLQSTSCSTLERVSLGKVANFEEGSMCEVSAGPAGAKVRVHRQGGQFYATSSASMDGFAVYKVVVDNGILYADIPSEKPAPKMVRRDPKDKRLFLLVGGGPGSLAAAETLRQEGFGGRILILTQESHLPYDRAALSKNLERPVDSLLMRPADFLEKWDIEVQLGTSVTKVDAKGQKVQYKAAGSDKEDVLEYDRVLVATGGSPKKLSVPGEHLPGIFTLRTPEDAAEIIKHAKRNRKIVVVGGSFIGMELASVLRKKGCDVSMIALETVPFERSLGRKVGAAFARLLQKEGVQWYGTAQVRLFRENKRGNSIVNGVELEDGEVLPADAVVIGAGVLPNTKFVEGVTLDKSGGIIVGPMLSAEAAPTLFAAGDVCSYPCKSTGSQVRTEHWDVAAQQGRVAARNMLGNSEPFATMPFFWSTVFGKSFRFVGHTPRDLEEVVVEGDVSGMEFISYYTEGEDVIAVASVNKDAVALACAELMRTGKMPKVSDFMIGIANQEVIVQRVSNLVRR